MANVLIPEELQALIDQYLTDGVLTDKERAVILKKAEGMGLDRDEIDLYLDAEVQKIDQATDAAVRRQKSKACPYCGASIPQLTDKCPECSQYITPEASKELQDILDNLEDALVYMKSGKDYEKNKATVERYVRKASLYYSNHPKIKILLNEVESEKKDVENKMRTISRTNSLISILKNKWVWAAIPIIMGIIAMTIGEFQVGRTRNSWQGFSIFCFLIGFSVLLISIIHSFLIIITNRK